jgi:acetyltransferase-like isoleucine patch superfamily enzyme
MTAGARRRGAARSVGWDVLLNGVAGSMLVPDQVRWLVYRRLGLHVERSAIGPGMWVSPLRPDITIGRGVYINRGCVILDAERVEIGDNVRFGPEVMLVGNGHEIGGPDMRAGERKLGTIVVGRGSWLGARVTVIADAEVGAGTIVAAGSLVRGKLEPNAIYAGTPAKLIRRLDG